MTWNNSKEKVLIGARENKLQKLQISQNGILRMTILTGFSQFLEIWILFILGSHKKLSSLVLLQITNYICSPWKM